jgi:hypothetical protein
MLLTRRTLLEDITSIRRPLAFWFDQRPLMDLEDGLDRSSLCTIDTSGFHQNVAIDERPIRNGSDV